ncbi:MAG: lysophospholipid acyltransferase family protein [Verrucomicrobia bacterium]|nr:lysophospholipid acyltransferase family protein [Verrucomicrobiota bacterium]
MTPSKRIRYLVEHVFLKLGLGIIRAAPLKPAVRCAEALGSLTFLLLASKRRVAIANILACDLGASPEEARRIAKASFRHFGAMIIEGLQAETRLTEENWRNTVLVKMPEDTLKTVSEPGLGVIVVTAHFGNWEIAAQCMSFIKPVVAVARHMNNPYTDGLIQNRKNAHRFRIVPKVGSFAKRLITPLENGDILAMLSDQHAHKSGVVVNFLGRAASCHTSPARLHLMTGAPLCFGYCVRLGLMQYRLELLPMIRYRPTGDRDADVSNILKMLTSELETAIRSNPEQYLWAHRRWRAELTPTA